MDGNLVFPVPPDDIIKKPAYPTLELLWGRGLLWWNGRRRTMVSAETPLIVEFFLDSPLKNMMDENLVFPVHPDDIIKKQHTRRWNYCGEAVYRGGIGAG